jgi:mono/diheme cytochrome c family protein
MFRPIISRKEDFLMSRSIAFLVSLMVIVAVISLGKVSYASEYDKGKALYDEKCMICHGADGKGDGPAAAALSPPPKDFNRPEFWSQKNLDQVITNQVKNGKGAMPAFSLTDKEIKEIIDYMSHTFKK